MAVKLGSSPELQIIGGAAQLAPPRPKLEWPLRVVREVAEPLSIPSSILAMAELELQLRAVRMIRCALVKRVYSMGVWACTYSRL